MGVRRRAKGSGREHTQRTHGSLCLSANQPAGRFPALGRFPAPVGLPVCPISPLRPASLLSALARFALPLASLGRASGRRPSGVTFRYPPREPCRCYPPIAATRGPSRQAGRRLRRRIPPCFERASHRYAARRRGGSPRRYSLARSRGGFACRSYLDGAGRAVPNTARLFLRMFPGACMRVIPTFLLSVCSYPYT